MVKSTSLICPLAVVTTLSSFKSLWLSHIQSRYAVTAALTNQNCDNQVTTQYSNTHVYKHDLLWVTCQHGIVHAYTSTRQNTQIQSKHTYKLVSKNACNSARLALMRWPLERLWLVNPGQDTSPTGKFNMNLCISALCVGVYIPGGPFACGVRAFDSNLHQRNIRTA